MEMFPVISGFRGNIMDIMDIMDFMDFMDSMDIMDSMFAGSRSARNKGVE